MIKGFRQIASLTALSRVFGLIRTRCFTHFIGSDFLDGWFIAFKIPNLSRRLFGEGAASASFIPVYSEQIHKDPKGAEKFASTVVSVIFVILSAIVVVGWLGIWGYKKIFDPSIETTRVLSLTSVMLPYMIMVCTVAIVAGILNVHKHFAAPAIAPVILNVFIIGTVLFSGLMMNIEGQVLLFAVAVSVLVAGLVQVAIQIGPLRRSGVRLRPAWQVQSEAFKKMMVMLGPMILGLTVTQLNTLFDDIIAWIFSASTEKGLSFEFFEHIVNYPLRRGCVKHLNVAQRLYQMPLGVMGISLATAIFPVMSAAAVRGDYDGLRKTISKGIGGVLFIALPATAGLLIVSRPLVFGLFVGGEFGSEDALASSMTLMFYAIGLTGFFAQQILTRAFYSLHDSKVPARSAVVAVFVNIVLNLVLIWPLGTGGLALSTAICAYLQVVILLWALRKRLGGAVVKGVGGNLLKTVVGTVIMGLCGAGVLFLMRGLAAGWKFELIRLGAIVPVCIAVYAITAKLLKNEMLSIIIGSKKGQDFSANTPK